MEVDLKTRLGNLELKSPIIVGSCPMTTNDMQRISMISNGAGALVLPSILVGCESEPNPDAENEFQSVDKYLGLIERVSKLESVPIIASLNGNISDDWGQLPARMEAAGASAIELSLRGCGTTNKDPRDIEDEIVALTKTVDQEIEIPLFLKLTRNFTNVSHFAKRLKPHVQGLVLFGKAPVVDLELDSMKLSTSWGLTQPGSVVRYLESLMRSREEFPQMPLVASGGVGTSVDLIKVLIAGADAAMVTSALYRSGPGVIGTLRDGLAKFMSDHDVATIDQLRTLCPPLSDIQHEIETTEYHSNVDNGSKAEDVNSDTEVQCDRYGHPDSAIK